MNQFIDPRMAQRNGGTPYFQQLPFSGPQPAPQNPLQVGPPAPATTLQAQPPVPPPFNSGALPAALGPMAGQTASKAAGISGGGGIPAARAPIPGTSSTLKGLQPSGSYGGGGPLRTNPGQGIPARNFRAAKQIGKAVGSREKLLRALMTKRGG